MLYVSLYIELLFMSFYFKDCCQHFGQRGKLCDGKLKISNL
jgi:hypothetical protein